MDLKKSMQQKNKNKFHTAHKEKESKKQRLNKTMAPQKNPFDEEDSQ